MNPEAALRELAAVLEAGDRGRGRDARLRMARQMVVDRSLVALGIEPAGSVSLASAIRLAAEATAKPARRDCAVLLVHALAVPGLVPAGCADDVRTLVEGALRNVLLRCGYPFGGSIEGKMRVLQRLHASLAELMQPLQPTFPNWQGLYAG
jgi:hypothetical protein